jgi:putative SOS response-associated peptidase YedK
MPLDTPSSSKLTIAYSVSGKRTADVSHYGVSGAGCDMTLGTYARLRCVASTRLNHNPLGRGIVRCLLPTSGYFECKVEGAGKQPYFVHSPDAPLLMFAGLWESWRENRDDREAEPSRTSTIVTGPPGIVSCDVHDRVPVILTAEQ